MKRLILRQRSGDGEHRPSFMDRKLRERERENVRIMNKSVERAMSECGMVIVCERNS